MDDVKVVLRVAYRSQILERRNDELLAKMIKKTMELKLMDKMKGTLFVEI